MIEYLTLGLIRVLSRCVGRLTLDNAPRVSEAISRKACRVAVLFLPDETKEAFRNEVLNHLLESVWDDQKRGISPETTVCRAVVRSFAMLCHAPGLRNDYCIIARDAGHAKRSIGKAALTYAAFPIWYWRWIWQRRTQRWGVVPQVLFAASSTSLLLVSLLNDVPLAFSILAAAPLFSLPLGLPYLLLAVDELFWHGDRATLVKEVVNESRNLHPRIDR